MAERDRSSGRMVRKGDLPQKPCAACGRPFAWRKKWAKVWDEVRYCSDRCRSNRPHAEERPKAASRSTQDRGASFETAAPRPPQDEVRRRVAGRAKP